MIPPQMLEGMALINARMGNLQALQDHLFSKHWAHQARTTTNRPQFQGQGVLEIGGAPIWFRCFPNPSVSAINF